MKAMIFAAGLGTRLKPLTDTMPKALVPICGKPLLQHVLEKLVGSGFDDVVINVHHFADMIEDWVARNPIDGLRVQFSDERQDLLETGGGVRHASPLLDDADRFLIHNVDILSNVDLNAFWREGESAMATLLVSERDTQRYLVFDNEMRLVGWTNIKTGEVKSPFPQVHEAFDNHYTHVSNAYSILSSPFLQEEGSGPYHLYAFAGIHQMNSELLPLMQTWPDKFSIIDFYLSICKYHKIKGYVQPELRLMDVGKIDTISQAEQFVS